MRGQMSRNLQSVESQIGFGELEQIQSCGTGGLCTCRAYDNSCTDKKRRKEHIYAK